MVSRDANSFPSFSMKNAWHFQPGGPFSTQRCAPGRLVLREVFHVVSSNMAAAETCLPLICW